MSKELPDKSAPVRSAPVSPSRGPLKGTPSTSPLASWRPSARLEAVERYGRFEILGRIGRGGMAEILLARERSDVGATRHLVIKRVLPEVRDLDDMLHMFLDETRVVMNLSHPNLCQIYEVGEQDGSWFIAMEWVNGVTLHQLARRAAELSQLDVGIVARVVSQCAEALHYAHTARDAEGKPLNLVHRDVSPHNVMIAYDGRVKLLDFGIAKSSDSTHHTEAGVVKGKICYMAPEQWLAKPVDARTDVFALGATLYEALCNRVAFKRENQTEVMKAALSGGYVPLREVAPRVPAELVAIVDRALAIRPEDRFQSAREMSEALERFVSGLSLNMSSARIAEYTRTVFQSELRLGPVLERALRGAQLEGPGLLMPPLPPSLLHLANVSMSGRPLPSQGGPTSIPPYGVSVPPFPLISERPWPEQSEVRTERARLKTGSHAPAVDKDLPSEQPTRPTISSLAGAPGAGSPSRPLARPLARTLSMRAVTRTRGVIAGALLALAAAFPISLAVRAHLDAPGAVMVRSDEAQRDVANAPRFSTMPAGVPVTTQLTPPSETREAGSTSPYSARLSINTKPWSTVYLGKRMLGSTPLADVPVPRGALNLKLVDRDGRVHIRRVPASKSKTRAIHYEF